MKRKVVFTYKDLENTIAEELIWYIEFTNDTFQIDNIPFYAYNNINHSSDRTARPFLTLWTENSKVPVGAMDKVNPR